MISDPATWFGLAALLAGAFCVTTIAIILRRQHGAERHRVSSEETMRLAAKAGGKAGCNGGQAEQDAVKRIAA